MTEEKKSNEEMGVVLFDQKAIEKLYPLKDFNLVLPSATIQKLSPFFKTTFEVIQIKEEETYEVPGGKGKRAIHKVGLDRFSNARGINWPADKNRLIADEGFPEKIVRFQATGEARRDDGTWLERSATYVLDLNEIKKEICTRHTERAESALKGSEKDLPVGLTKATKDAWIERQTERDMTQKRKYRVQLAESGATNRVINKFLTLKGTYTKDELKKQFVIPRNIFIPDIQDASTRNQIVTEASRASSQLYGGAPSARIQPVIDGQVVNGHIPDAEVEPTPESPKTEKPPVPPPASAPTPVPDTPKADSKPPLVTPPPVPATPPAIHDPAPAPEAPAPTLEELFPTYNPHEQADVLKQLIKSVDWMKPFRPDIEKWKQEHRDGFFVALMAEKKKKEEKPY